MIISTLGKYVNSNCSKCLTSVTKKVVGRDYTVRNYLRSANFDRRLKGQKTLISDDLSVTHDKHLANMLNSLSSPGLQVASSRIQKDAELPYGHHLIYFNPLGSHLGADGYDDYQAPKSVEDQKALFKRRMWVGGELIFNNEHPLKYLQFCNCFETVDKTISSNGNMFVQIRREMKTNSILNLTESRMLIYTNELFNHERATESAFRSNTKLFDTSTSTHLSRDFLFRFSALSYNAHKIHYDFDYAKNYENYPSILLHGPLTVVLLLQWFANLYPKLRISRFEYKNKFPLFVTDHIIFKIRQYDSLHYFLWLENESGILCCESKLHVA